MAVPILITAGQKLSFFKKFQERWMTLDEFSHIVLPAVKLEIAATVTVNIGLL